MSHKRTDIRSAVKALLLGTAPDYATDAGANVYANRLWNHAQDKLPSINLVDGDESSAPLSGTDRRLLRDWELKIELRVEGGSQPDSDVDALCLQVETLMNANRQLGGLATGSLLTGTSPEYDGSGEKLIAKTTLTYTIKYISIS